MTTPLDHENARALAVLETEMRHMKAAMEDLKFSNQRQDTKLDTVLQTMHEARGSWRTLLLMGGAAGSLGGLVTWIFSHWRG
ncbi:MAG: hypothetical protein V4641_21640 [Pseudomonadota bacterium]